MNTTRQRPIYHTSFWLLSLPLALLWHLFMLPQSPPVSGQLCQNQEILFIGSSRPLASNDEPLRLYLLALGQRVTVRTDKEVKTEDAQGKALIIISETSESAAINTKFRAVAVPILTWEGWLQDDLAMTAAGNLSPSSETTGPTAEMSPQDKDEGAYGERVGQRAIRIINENHPLAAGYHGEVTTVFSRQSKFHWGVPAPSAIRVAVDIADEQHSMLYAYESGAVMVGYTAPARRVFLHNASAPYLTHEGLTLFLTAAYWAMNCLDEPITPTPTATPTALSTITTPTAIPTEQVTPTSTSTSTSTAFPTIQVTPTSTATPTVTSTPQPAEQPLIFEKQDLLFNDRDVNGQVSAGDILLYTIQIVNRGPNKLTELVIEDQVDLNTILLNGSVQSTLGTVANGNQSEEQTVVVKIAELAANQKTQISFQVRVAPTTATSLIRNQAFIHYIDQARDPTGQQQYLSDDPDTPGTTNDATLTPLESVRTHPVYLPWIAK